MKTYVRVWVLVPVSLIAGLLGGVGVWFWLSSQTADIPKAPPEAEAPHETPHSEPPADVKVVSPTPGSGGGRHPTFDCKAFEGKIPKMPDAGAHDLRTIEALGAEGEALEGKLVRVRAKVMAAYPKIMGSNWLSLCDAEGGGVLVATTSAWAHKGALVIVEGTLVRNKNIGGAYTFPLLLEGTRILSEEMPEPEGPVDL